MYAEGRRHYQVGGKGGHLCRPGGPGGPGALWVVRFWMLDGGTIASWDSEKLPLPVSAGLRLEPAGELEIGPVLQSGCLPVHTPAFQPPAIEQPCLQAMAHISQTLKYFKKLALSHCQAWQCPLQGGHKNPERKYNYRRLTSAGSLFYHSTVQTATSCAQQVWLRIGCGRAPVWMKGAAWPNPVPSWPNWGKLCDANAPNWRPGCCGWLEDGGWLKAPKGGPPAL